MPDDDPDLTPPPLDESGDTPASTEDSLTTPPPGGGVAPGQGKLSEPDDKNFGMLAHMLGGLTNFLGPLIIWMIKKDESPFVADQGKEALNFQITVAIGFVVSFIVGLIPLIQCVAILLFPLCWVAGLVFGILGCLEATKGRVYRYPFALRLVN